MIECAENHMADEFAGKLVHTGDHVWRVIRSYRVGSDVWWELSRYEWRYEAVRGYEGTEAKQRVQREVREHLNLHHLFSWKEVPSYLEHLVSEYGGELP